MFSSLFGIVENVVRVAVAPVEIAAAIVKPVTDIAAEAAQAVVDEVKDLTQD